MALFSKLQDLVTQPEFWSRMADDVDWTVKGTHPLAGRYHNKAEQKTEPATLALAKNRRLS
jgi:uncharacterized protein